MARSYPVMLVLALLLITQRWLGLESGIRFLQAKDAYNYLAIARAAPHFPGQIVFHHAQRMASHWIVGNISHISGIPLNWVYGIATAGLCLTILKVVLRTLSRFHIASPMKSLLFFSMLLNPYFFRYYWIMTPMISDLIFILGLAIVMDGLTARHFKTVFWGAVLAALGRQNIILVLPGITAGLFLLDPWKSQPLQKRGALAAAVIGATLIIYKATSLLAQLYAAAPSQGLSVMLSILPWLFSPDYSQAEFVNHLSRVFFPLLLPTAIFGASFGHRNFRAKLRTPESLVFLLIIAGLVSGALLPEPATTSQNQTRLTSLALVPVCCWLGWLWSETKHLTILSPGGYRGTFLKVALFFTLTAASLHHMTTWIGPSTVIQFAIFHLAICAVFLGLLLVYLGPLKRQAG